MYDRIKVEFWGVQQVLQSSHIVSTVPLPSGEPKLGDDLARLCRLADAVRSFLRHAHEEIEQDTKALKQVQGENVEQRRVVEQEKDSL